MINMNEFKKKLITDYDSPAFVMMERVINEMGKREIDPYYIMGVHVPAAHEGHNKDWNDIKVSENYICVDCVYRHNGTGANVTVKISVCKKTSESTATRICVVKVPKDASDKVINKRIDKVVEYIG